MMTQRQRKQKVARELMMREEIDSILRKPMAEWGDREFVRVEELADLLGYTDNDCYWRSF